MRTGFTGGSFDLLHAGHVLFFRAAKKKCDILVVGLHVDPSIERPEKNKPIQSIYERYIQLRGCKYVDQIIPYETEENLKVLMAYGGFDVRFLGGDYLNQEHKIIGKDILPIEYIPRTHTYSSSELRERIKV